MRKPGMEIDATGDRRVRRTRTALHTALVTLLATRSYDDLTVADICDAADVGRSAFYAHFKGKDDLLRSGFAQLESDLAGGNGDPKNFSAAFFAHARAHHALFGAMMHSHAAVIATSAIRRILLAQAMEVLPDTTAGGVTRTLRAQLLVDMLMSVTRWWLDQGANQPVAEIDAVFRDLAGGILKAEGDALS